jgi:hypothetical protein
VKKRKLLVGGAVLVSVGALAFFAWYQLVKAGILRYNKYDRREQGSLKVGASAPDLPLTLYDGTPMRLSELWNTKPVFLVFGSCT